jgi:UDP-N-acetylglucosamine 2-epimerase
MKVMVVIGTRPEAIKLAPVIHELGRHRSHLSPFVCVTGQHRELLGTTLEILGVRADRNLAVMQYDQDLAGLTSRLFKRIGQAIDDERPDWVLVQGDTTTAMVGAMAAFYRRARVGHVEAGLRTGDLRQPFPEELNRRIADLCADLCFAPTDSARTNLLAEGVSPARVFVTGNTIVDAVREVAARPYDERFGPLAAIPRGRRWVLVTAHRRENFGEPLERICSALRRLAQTLEESVHFIVPVHPNPNVRATVSRLLAAPNCSVVPPLDYHDLIFALRRASLALTDSGGLQEEAPTFGVPVLVLREKTERPEGIAAGAARLVGTDPDVIVAEAIKILTATGQRQPIHNPYGDGAAARRIVAILRRTSGLSSDSDANAAEEWRLGGPPADPGV